MINQIILTAEGEDRQAVEQEFQDVISRVMSATFEVNPPGEWECTQESYLHTPGPSTRNVGETITHTLTKQKTQGQRVFMFTANDNAVGESADDA